MLVDMRPVESSENITIMDEIDELLGTRRSYGWNSGSRPSMISAKYRLKEERRKVLKISVNKMKKIDDAESSLCRSVLINNTVKRLQAETRDDRTTGRTSPSSPPSPTSVGYGYHGPQQSQPCNGVGGNPQLVDITNLRESPGGSVVPVGKTLANNNSNINNNNNNNSNTNNNNNKSLVDAESSSLASADHHHHHNHHHHHHHHHQHHNNNNSSSSNNNNNQSSSTAVQYEYDNEDDVEDDDDDDDTIASIMMQLPSSTSGGGSTGSSSYSKRKRSVDEPLDDLLSQFINNNHREDEDVNVVDLDLHEYPAAKRLRTDEAAAAAAAAVAAGTAQSAADLCPSDCWSLMDTCCDDSLDLYGGQVPAAVEHQDVLLPVTVAARSVVDADCCPLTSTAAITTATTTTPLSLLSLQQQHHHHQNHQHHHQHHQQSSACTSTTTSTSTCTSVTSQDEHYGGGAPASGSTSPTNLSCGQASMFSEMQSAMFRNLIASLES